MDNAKLLKKHLLKSIVEFIRIKIGPRLIQQVMDKFQVELIGKVSLDDVSAPEHFQDDFMRAITEDIDASLISTPGGVGFSFGNKDKLGYSGEVTSPLQTMVFLLEGILGEYAFISPIIFALRRGNSGASKGRWDHGFLITKETFLKEGWEKVVPWEKARWGFSNTGPINIFEIDQTFIAEEINNAIKQGIETFAAVLRARH